MAFCVTWTGLNDKNIKHIYSTREPKFRTRRSRIYNPTSLSLELSQHRKPKVTERDRLFAYDDRYDACLPRAPAFGDPLPSHYVDGMVSRLAKKSQIKLTPRACAHYQRDFAKYKYEEEEPGEETRRTGREVREIVNRLLEPNVCTRSHYAFTMHEPSHVDTMTPVHE